MVPVSSIIAPYSLISGSSVVLGYLFIMTTRIIDNIQIKKRYRYKTGIPDMFLEILNSDKIG